MATDRALESDSVQLTDETIADIRETGCPFCREYRKSKGLLLLDRLIPGSISGWSEVRCSECDESFYLTGLIDQGEQAVPISWEQ